MHLKLILSPTYHCLISPTFALLALGATFAFILPGLDKFLQGPRAPTRAITELQSQSPMHIELSMRFLLFFFFGGIQSSL